MSVTQAIKELGCYISNKGLNVIGKIINLIALKGISWAQYIKISNLPLVNCTL